MTRSTQKDPSLYKELAEEFPNSDVINYPGGFSGSWAMKDPEAAE